MRPWSYSSLEKFETCPRQYYETKIAESVVEPPTEHTIWGKEVHSAFEHRILNNTPLPQGMLHWEPFAAKLHAMPGEKAVEVPIALDRGFGRAEWDKAWTRGVIDLLVLNKEQAGVLDYKTGKRKPSGQLNLYAVYVFALYPAVQTVQTAYVWLKDKKIDRSSVNRSEAPAVWNKFIERVARLESAHERGSWPERPSGLCNGWCPVQSCMYYKKKA